VTAATESRLGSCLTTLGRHEEAEPFLLTGYAGLQSDPAAPPVQTRRALERIVQLYDAWGKKDKAAEWQAKLAPPPLLRPSSP
jgi:hypothetical protein